MKGLGSVWEMSALCVGWSECKSDGERQKQGTVGLPLGMAPFTSVVGNRRRQNLIISLN